MGMQAPIYFPKKYLADIPKKPYIDKEQAIFLAKPSFFKPVSKIQNVDIPKYYQCPISSGLMRDPVICSLDNESYDRSSIKKYLATYGRSPLKDEALGDKAIDTVLISNINLRDAIEAFMEKNGSAFRCMKK